MVEVIVASGRELLGALDRSNIGDASLIVGVCR